MPDLTATELTDLQNDLGITDDESVFTDEELHRNHNRVIDDLGEVNLAAVRVYCFRQLVSQAARLFNYTAGQSKVSRKQVRDNLRQDLAMWREEAGLVGGIIAAGTIDLDLDEAEPTTASS